MISQELNQPAVFTVNKADDGWFVVIAGEPRLGPYRNAALVIEVATARALLARRRGSQGDIFVQDAHGGMHKCLRLDWSDDRDRCGECEASWPAVPDRGRCPVRAELLGS
jgi:hypothetical protein